MAIRQFEFLPITASGAGLACVSWVHPDENPTGAFCLVENHFREASPSSVCYALVKTGEIVLLHVVDVQIFDGDAAEILNDLMRKLVCEIFSFVSNAFVDTRHCFALAPSISRASFMFGHASLRFRKSLLLSLEEPWVGDMSSIRQSHKGKESCINANEVIQRRQWRFFNLAREGDKPFARRGLSNRASFDLAFGGPVNYGRHASNLGKVNICFANSEAALRIRERIIAPSAFEARIPWLFATFHTTEERLKSKLDAPCNILKHLRVHASQVRDVSLQQRKRIYLIIKRKTFLLTFPTQLALLKQMVIQLPALLQRILKQAKLSLRGINSVLKSLSHVLYHTTKRIQMSSKIFTKCLTKAKIYATHTEQKPRLKPGVLNPNGF